MKTAVQSRRDRGVFNTALGALCVLGLSCTAQGATAADTAGAVSVDMAALSAMPAPAPQAEATPALNGQRPGVVIKDGVVTMLPVGDSAPEKAPAAKLASLPAEGTERDAKSGDSEENCLAKAVYFEARGESRKGQEAVAEVVLARTRAPDRPKTICGVVYEGVGRGHGCQFSFACDGVADVVRDDAAWACAQEIASSAIKGGDDSLVSGATYYHANYVRPSWASHMIKVAQIGSHIFYKPRNA